MRDRPDPTYKADIEGRHIRLPAPALVHEPDAVWGDDAAAALLEQVHQAGGAEIALAEVAAAVAPPRRPPHLRPEPVPPVAVKHLRRTHTSETHSSLARDTSVAHAAPLHRYALYTLVP